MSFSSEILTSGSSLRQRGYDDSWGSEFNAGADGTYCAGSGHATVFKIVIPTASLTNKYYLTLNFNGIVRTNGSRTLNYGISTASPTSYSPSNLPSFLSGTTGTITYSSLTTQSKQLTLTIGSSSAPFTSTSTTLYVWLYNTNSSYSMECYNGTSYYSATIYRQSIGAPTAPTNVYITSGSSSKTKLSYVTPTQGVYVRWSGATAGVGATIKGYRVWYRPDSSTTASSIDVDSTSGSTYIKIPGYSRGDKLVASVQTLNSGDLYSPNTQTSNKPIVNTLPSINSISYQDSILSGSSLTFNFSGKTGNSTYTGSTCGDYPTQSLSFRYSTSTTGTKYNIDNNGSLSFNSYTGNDYTEATRYFWAYDGYEYSNSYKTAKIKIFSKITASLSSSNFESVESIDGKKYLKTGIFTISTNKTENYISGVNVKIGTTQINNNYTYDISGTNIIVTIDFTKQNISSLLSENTNNTVLFTVTSNMSDTAPVSSTFSTANVGTVYNGGSISFDASNYITSDLSSSNLVKEKVNLKSSLFTSDLKKKVSNITIKRGVGSSSSNLSYNPYDDLTYNSTFDDISSVSEGKYIGYQIIITDLYGVSTIYNTPTTFQKLYKPVIINSANIQNLAPDNIYKPISVKFIDATDKILKDPGDNQINIKINTTNIKINNTLLSASTYKINSWTMKLNGKEEFTKETDFTVSTGNQGEIILQLRIDSLIAKAKSSYSVSARNQNYNAYLSIGFTDQFGLDSDLYSTNSFLKIDFTEPPIFSGNLTISHVLRVDEYGTSAPSLNWEGVSSESYQQKVNPNEWIRFTGPTVSDANITDGSENKSSLKYSLYRAEIKENSILDYKIFDNILDKTYSNGIFTHYVKSAPSYSDIKKYKYKLVVKDTSNLSDECYSGFPTTTPYDLICFPTNSLPNFNDLISFNKDGEFTIKIDNNLCGYNEYSVWKNLERTQYGKDFKVAVFSSTDYNTILNLSNDSWNNSNIFSYSSLADGHGETPIITRAPSGYSTTYYRVGLKLSTGLKADGNTKNYIYTWSQIYSIDPNNPVVSIRKNYLGINTGSTIDTDDTILLQINSLSSGNRKIIKLYGPDTDNPVTIEINLKEGTIDGAIIDGGSW